MGKTKVNKSTHLYFLQTLSLNSSRLKKEKNAKKLRSKLTNKKLKFCRRRLKKTINVKKIKHFSRHLKFLLVGSPHIPPLKNWVSSCYMICKNIVKQRKKKMQKNRKKKKK